MYTSTLLHAGCGLGELPPGMGGPLCKEVRLDIDPETKPDIIASLTNLGDIGLFDKIYCSHCLEHLTRSDGQIALKEFLRVLKPSGIAIIMVPDLEGVKPTEETVYECGDAKITGLDIIYGYGRYVDANPFMQHKNGFVKRTLEDFMLQAGFRAPHVMRIEIANLLAWGIK